MNGNGDNISLGKRSISSEYTNLLITDEYERQQQFNGINGHHQNGANIYTNARCQQVTVITNSMYCKFLDCLRVHVI